MKRKKNLIQFLFYAVKKEPRKKSLSFQKCILHLKENVPDGMCVNNKFNSPNNSLNVNDLSHSLWIENLNKFMNSKDIRINKTLDIKKKTTKNYIIPSTHSLK